MQLRQSTVWKVMDGEQVVAWFAERSDAEFFIFYKLNAPKNELKGPCAGDVRPDDFQLTHTGFSLSKVGD